MPGRVQDDHPAVGDIAGDKLTDLLGGDDVLAALEDERRNGDIRKVLAVVGGESHSSERFGDFGIRAAETIRQLLTELRPVGICP